ncbi:MAG: hypothetical protein IPQ24_20870 [Anaeromyxobacter sp.]|nr:hypothetical protein [Anaeromyxobacter sp.]
MLEAVAGQAVVLALPATPLGRTLTGRVVLLPGPGDAPVRVSLQAAGEEVGALELDAAHPGQAFRLDTSRLAGRSHDLSVVLTAAGSPARPACLEALALP